MPRGTGVRRGLPEGAAKPKAVRDMEQLPRRIVVAGAEQRDISRPSLARRISRASRHRRAGVGRGLRGHAVPAGQGAHLRRRTLQCHQRLRRSAHPRAVLSAGGRELLGRCTVESAGDDRLVRGAGVVTKAETDAGCFLPPMIRRRSSIASSALPLPPACRWSQATASPSAAAGGGGYESRSLPAGQSRATVAARHRRQPGLRRPRHRAAARAHDEPPVPSLFTFQLDDPRLTGLAGLSVERAPCG